MNYPPTTAHAVTTATTALVRNGAGLARTGADSTTFILMAVGVILAGLLLLTLHNAALRMNHTKWDRDA